VAHRRRLNKESSPDCLVLQVAYTTISPNYLGEEFETLDRQILVAMPKYHRKTEKQTRNVKSEKTPTLPELFDDNKRSQPLPQLQAFNRLTLDRSTPTSSNKHSWYQWPRNSDATTIHLVPTDYVREISSGTSSATDMNSTTHRRPTWELPSLS
jgi:hypothetical protein